MFRNELRLAPLYRRVFFDDSVQTVAPVRTVIRSVSIESPFLGMLTERFLIQIAFHDKLPFAYFALLPLASVRLTGCQHVAASRGHYTSG